VPALPVSVVVPTLGRSALEACVESIGACDPLPAEVLLSAQSGALARVERTALAGPPGTRAVGGEANGVSGNTNVGIRLASHPIVAVTHDDCTVEPDWVGRAYELARSHPHSILTGRVLPSGDPARVPSCKVDLAPHDFTGVIDPGALYPANMVLPRDLVLELGGFDERFRLAGEDGDLAYRWLRLGRSLRYEPSLVVHHHDWRSDEDLARLFVTYGRGSGLLYAKYLWERDREIVRFLKRDAHIALWILKCHLVGDPVPMDWRRGLPSGLPRGLLSGLRHVRPGSPWGLRGSSPAPPRRA
jgi:GT2 family glycosyltransferase